MRCSGDWSSDVCFADRVCAGFGDRKVMPVGVCYERGRKETIQVYPADEHSSVVRKTETVATATITENNCSVRSEERRVGKQGRRRNGPDNAIEERHNNE